MAACSAGLAVNADVGAHLWPLFVFPALTAGLCIVGVVIAFNILGERLFEQAQAVRR